MKTIEDAVMGHAEEINRDGISCTGDGIRMLEIEHTPNHHAAGNLYLAALGIINEYHNQLVNLGKILDEISEGGKYEDIR